MFVQGESLQLNLAFALETYQGVVMRTLKSTQESVFVKGDSITVPWVLESKAILQRDLSNVFVTVVAVGWTPDNRTFFAKDVFDIDSPAVTISMPSEIEQGLNVSLPVTAAFTNPLDFQLPGVCVTLFSHDLQFEGMAPLVTQLTHCVDLPARQTMQLHTQLLSPCKAASCIVMASVAGDFLPTATASSEVSTVPPNAKSRTDSVLPAVVVGVAAIISLLLGIGACRHCQARRRSPTSWLNVEWPTAGAARTELQETA
jgi:hypothetical protein